MKQIERMKQIACARASAHGRSAAGGARRERHLAAFAVAHARDLEVDSTNGVALPARERDGEAALVRAELVGRERHEEVHALVWEKAPRGRLDLEVRDAVDLEGHRKVLMRVLDRRRQVDVPAAAAAPRRYMDVPGQSPQNSCTEKKERGLPAAERAARPVGGQGRARAGGRTRWLAS